MKPRLKLNGDQVATPTESPTNCQPCTTHDRWVILECSKGFVTELRKIQSAAQVRGKYVAFLSVVAPLDKGPSGECSEISPNACVPADRAPPTALAAAE